MNQTDIGVYGLGVMGRNLALNLEDNGYKVSVHNRNIGGEEFIQKNFLDEAGKNKNLLGADSVEEFVKSIATPRKILIMVKAGNPVDQVIDQLIEYLDEGDVLIDGGNSHFPDTARRVEALAGKGIHFVGMGVSGGEEGARFGPSLMPGGSEKAWPLIKPLFEAIAAKAFDGSACCAWIGKQGAGHFIKMVHNGIEYADMQLISEAYHIMSMGMGMSAVEISGVFKKWGEGPLSSYLLEISAEILLVNDEDGAPLVDKILDSAGQKGTGKWTAVTALELGAPLPMISQSVYQRFFSSLKDLRTKASGILEEPEAVIEGDRVKLLETLRQAFLASRVVAHAEGFYLIKTADMQYGWEINPASAARIWQGGCIIRSSLLQLIEQIYRNHPETEHLLLQPDIAYLLGQAQQDWRDTISASVQVGIPLPCMSSALTQYDTLRNETLPANLIQAQRDYFGAHTYERIDKPRGEFFHTKWQ